MNILQVIDARRLQLRNDIDTPVDDDTETEESPLRGYFNALGEDVDHYNAILYCWMEFLVC